MKLTKAKIIILILSIQVTGLFLVYRNVVKPPESVENKKADYNLNASQLYMEFTKNNTAFDGKYLNKIIDLTGIVTSVHDSVLVLNNKVLCVTNMKFTDTIKDTSIKLKGKYVGYDELFDNLKMSECLIESL